MTIYVIVGSNDALSNTSARAAYSTRALAEAHLASPDAMWFDDRAVIVELEVDRESRFNFGARPAEEEDPRERDEDDGSTYADPRDEMAERRNR